MNDFKSRTLAASFFATFAFLTIARAASEGRGWTNLFNGRDLSGWTQTTGTVRLQSAKPSSQKRTAPNTLTKAEKNAGWRLLWDGKSTDGWRSPKGEDFPKQGWTIEDGELRVQAIGSGEAAAGGDIITRERFSDFELMVDFKLTPGANSGIKYFVQPNLAPIGSSGTQAAGSAIGLEYQLLDDARHPDAKLGRDGNRTVSSLYDLITAAATKPIKAIGYWNTARIVSRGRHVEHWLNGQKVVEYDRGSPACRELVKLSKYKDIPNFGEWPDGHILLQEHGNVVAFRNIKIRVPSKSAAVHRK